MVVTARMVAKLIVILAFLQKQKKRKALKGKMDFFAIPYSYL